MPLCVPIRRAAALVALLGCGMAAPMAWADTFLVTQVGDNGFGSLRQALLDANARPGPDEILFALGPIPTPPVFLNLDSALPTITDSVRIVGPGSNLVITQRNPIGNPPNFAILRASGAINVEIRGLSITSGTGSQGAAISATAGTLTIADCLIFENDNADIGGAIAVIGSGDCTLNVTNSQLFANTAGTMGGGIAVIRNGGRATVTLNGVVISRNNLVSNGSGNLGAGLYVAGTGGPHTVSITGCTIDSNAISFDGVGGGIYVDAAGGTLSITNSTIASNNASMGAAIAYQNAALTIRGCTFTANTTVSDASGGCIKDLSNAGFTVVNTILSANTSAFQLRDLGVGQIATGNNNLIGVGGPFTNGVNGNIVGVTNPRLVPININGGPTLTFALQPDSPAIDAGSNADASPTDQRGQPRPADGDNNGTAIADIGAFESQRFLVTNTNTAGPGSLRQAIEDNNLAGGGFVKFSIAPLGSAKTIALTQTLPILSRTLFIDGWSQGGPGYRGAPLVEIDGSQLSNTCGLDIQWSDCIIRGLAINSYSGAAGNGVGIKISEQAGLRNWLYANYVGVGLDGTTNKGNGQIGVWLAISANTNLVGTNADGVNDEVERNVISGSSLHGLKTGVFIQSNSNVIAGNLIGTNAAGLGAIPNFNGVWVENGTSNRIGSSPFSANPLAERNVISGNQNAGISFTSQGSNNSISGNFIGVNSAGAASLPNLIGVLLENVNQTLVGGTHNGARNVISGNAQHGVVISGTGATGNLIQGNYIGTDVSGDLGIGNAAAGVIIRAGASSNRIGAFGDDNPTFEPLRRNVISASGGRGVVIRDASSQLNRVLGNYIGTTKSGLLPLGNMNAGIAIDDSPSNVIGSRGSGRNVIAAGRSTTNGNGVEITGVNAQGNRVQNNLIGLGADGQTQLPNTVAGVSIGISAAFNLIGGTTLGEGNLIRSNTGAGVRVLSDESIANSILGNSIFASGALGIDLKDDGVTPNGPSAVLRVGPNNLQNYPVIQSVSIDGMITSTLEAAANTTFRIEYFASTTPDPSGFGEGLTFLGSRNVTTNASGLTGEFTFSATLIPGQPWITTTATRLAPSIESVTGFPTPPGTPLGTSEFSLARLVNTEPTPSNVTASTLEDTDVIVTLQAMDPDPNTTFSFRVATLPIRGSLLQFGTLTPIVSNDTAVTDPSGRVVFRPEPNTFNTPYTSFSFIASDGIADSLPGPATINVAPVADTPSVTNATTREDVQTTSGLVISRNAVDGTEVTHFRITSIQNGLLFKNDGVTPISNGDFITAAEGAAGLKFTPALNSTITGSFNVQASLSSSPADIGGGIATASIFVTAVADTPSVTNASTLEDTQSSSGLVISRNIADGPEVTHFRITSVSGGQVFLADGSTAVSDGQFITAAQGAAGLRLTPPADFFGNITLNVQAATGSTINDLGGAAALATVTVRPVNDRPSFTASSPAPSLEDAGQTVVSGWAAFSPGPANESDQTVLAYSVSALTNTSLFSATPTIDASGTLRYTSAPNANGSAQFTVTVRDSGGTADGGVDISLPQTFTITVLPVNDQPALIAADPAPVLEDSGAAIVANWASINPGPSDESAQIALSYAVSGVTEPALFASLPTVDAAGTLRYTPAPNAFGSSQFTVTARDNGGTANGGIDLSLPRTFTIVVNPVNDQPTFSASNPPASLEDSGQVTVAGWASFNPGPSNESTQTALGYTVTGVTNTSLFASFPTVDASGTLRYTPAPDAFGTAQFTVSVRDDGGTTNGGIDTSTNQTFTITVLPVNDAPTFTAAQPPAILQDSAAQTVSGFVTGFNPGPSNESAQSALAYIVDNVSNPGLFDAPIAVSASGTLTYTPASGIFGSSTFQVRARDNGGVSNGGVDTSAPQTFVIIVRPAAVCQNVFIDARRNCVARTVQPSQINRTPADPSSGATQSFSYSRNLNQDFPIGSTPVVVTVDYSDGLRSQCIATVTVVASDCNNNSVPDACESIGGTLRDCNDDAIPDDCQCIWDNGAIDPSTAANANGQLSHNGGAVIMAVQTADDFYLAPGSVYSIFGFQGQMFTNSFATIRKARLSFFEDCNGQPADQPFKTYLSTGILSTVPGPTGFDLVTYDFNFCSDSLVLDGGKVYWVSLVGLSDGTGKDSSYWVTTTAQSAPNAMMGLPPVRRTGTPGASYGQFIFDPWQPAQECCAGCVNMAWKLNGMSCQILHDNGKPVLGQAAGGRVSGADRANPLPPRTADDFVVKPCTPVKVCYVETYIWTNCSPTTGFIELYGATTCGDPMLTPIFTATNPHYESLNQQIVVDGSVLNLYKLSFRNLTWALAPGMNYWLTTGANSGGSVNGRTLFAYAGSCHDFTCRQQQFGSARFLDRFSDPLAWAKVTGTHAFRIAVSGAPLNGAPPAQPGTAASCSTDVNSDRATNVQDIFDFLNAWFTGCP